MEKWKFYAVCVAMAALTLTSCTKDDGGNDQMQNKATLTFGTIVQDLAERTQNKQSDLLEFPDCSDDAPAYVEIVLMQGDTEIVGSMADPFRIDLVSGQLFTKYVPELELVPGDYSLEYFAVYNANGVLKWLAPRGGVLADFLDEVLPYNISLRAGVKQYTDVTVLCFDNRDVNQYGYEFFDLIPTEVFEYCFFGNYCNENGRHYPARYSIDIDVDGEPFLRGVENSVGTTNAGEPYADPLCLQLPNLTRFDDEEDYIDYTITLLDWEGVYDANEMTISGSLSRDDIMDNFEGDSNLDYQHLFFGCEDGDGSIPEDVPDFSEAIFSDPTNLTNPYYGPPAFAIYEYEAYEVEEGEIGSEAVETILIERRSETKEIMGITVVIQHDAVYEDGVIREDTDDWLAQDDSGNIWYMGEDSKTYDENGEYVNNEGSWEAGVDGALPGYWLPADPYAGQVYYQEYYKGEAEDYAEVVALDATVVTDMDTYENVLVTKDVNPFEPNVYELKYYAPGFGLIKEEGYEDGELVEVVVLTGIIME
ncbi:hypothetical protein [Salinimicrobium soli]|uniref:hypothetical protein n=1 Tax=Salinimicrobium soli TaxID=1254399 RepID=UPI003AADBDCB